MRGELEGHARIVKGEKGFLALPQPPQRGTLAAPRGQLRGDVPQQRRDAVAEDQIDDTARLLRTVQILAQCRGMGDRVLKSRLRDLIEENQCRSN